MARSAISVVIPTYNVEAYLDDCLASLRAQTMPDFDVVVVNDGSTDRSGEIADRWAAEDDRFIVVHQANTGPGPGGGRNGGLASTKSDLLIFLDSDDAFRPDALAKIVRSFELEPQVEVVTTSACRLVGAMTRPSHFHDVSHSFAQQRTTAIESPWLMFDSTPWNKAFRRPFFDRVVGHWPAQQLYEDIAPMTTALLQATGIAVLTNQHYLWRTRGEGSITHESLSIKGDLAQLEQLRLAREQVLQARNDELLMWFDWKSITSDMLWMTRKLPRTSGDVRKELHHELQQALAVINPALVAAVQPGLGRCYAAVQTQTADDAVQVIARNRLSLNQDRRSPSQAIQAAPGTVSVQLVRSNSEGIALTTTSRDVDLRNAALRISSRPPWSLEDAAPNSSASTTVQAARSTRKAATFSLKPNQLKAHGSADLYLSVHTSGDRTPRELKRSIVDVARSRLTPARSTGSSAAVAFFDDSWLRLSVGVRTPKITSVVNQDQILVCTGSSQSLPDQDYVAFLTETGTNVVTEAEFAWIDQGASFQLRIPAGQRHKIGATPHFLSLAAWNNQAIPLPLAIDAPVVVSFDDGLSAEQIRVDHGSQGQAFLQRHTSARDRARHLVDEVRAKQIFSGLRAGKSKNSLGPLAR